MKEDVLLYMNEIPLAFRSKLVTILEDHKKQINELKKEIEKLKALEDKIIYKLENND